MGDAPIKWSKKTATWEISYLRYGLIRLTHFSTWGYRRLIKPMFYHPIAIAGITVLVTSYIISPWLTAALFWALLAWQRIWPYHYREHAHTRIQSFRAGIPYRYRLRGKLTANGLLNDKDPTPTISTCQRIGCTVRVWIKMSWGDDIHYWQERSSRIAQTFNAQRAIINQHRRPSLLPWKKELTTKYRWLRIDFLDKDPFATPIGIEYIHQHRINIIKQTQPEIIQGVDEKGAPVTVTQTKEIDVYQPSQQDPLGPKTDGTPYYLDTDLSLLNVSITGGGKSNAERTYIYTGYRDVLNNLKENWGCDLARGVELNPIKHVFARLEDGKKGPKSVLQFWTDARNVVWNRLDEMEEQGINYFIPTPYKPALDIYFDEAALLETPPYAEVRKAIYGAQSEILLGGRKCRIRIFAFTQRSKLDQFPLRDDYPQTHLGRVKTRRQVAMATDYDFYERGGTASDINPDQPGIYYAETTSDMTPTAFRFTETTIQDCQALPQCPPSVLWQPPPEQTTTQLPVTPIETVPIPATPQARRLHLHTSRRTNQPEHQTEDQEAMR